MVLIVPRKQKKEKASKQPPAQHYTKNSAHATPPSSNGMEIVDETQPAPPPRRYSGKVLLALDDDKNFLSPLRCFLRENVCIFTTNSLTKKTTIQMQHGEGKVGLGCIHCLQAGQKSSNRAVCFPNTMGRVYQGVADMQRFQ